MGGFGSGGAPGVGRKPKERSTAQLHGSRDRSRAGQAGSAAGSAPSVELEPVVRPADLPAEFVPVWDELAPLAMKQRTLIPATVGAFRDLCRAIVIAGRLWETIERDGLTHLKTTVDADGNEVSELKKHPLIGDHRGWVQRVEAGRARFRLAPFGKELDAGAGAPADPFAEFDQPVGGVQ